MDSTPVQPPQANSGDGGLSQPAADIAVALHSRLSGLPQEPDGGGSSYVGHPADSHTGNNEPQAPIIDDDDSSSPSPSSVPSAATTRVNSGLDEDTLNTTSSNNLASELGKHISNIGTVELNSPPADVNGPAPNHRDPLSKRMKAMWTLLLLFLFKTIFTGLFTAFIIVVLINKVVETPGNVYWDASTTNYVVGVLSQISVLLTTTSVRDLFAVLRPVLASRHAVKPGDRPGSSFASWVGLSPAAGWSSVFQVAAVGGFLNPWCNMRLLLPIAMLGFGSILKCECD